MEWIGSAEARHLMFDASPGEYTPTVQRALLLKYKTANMFLDVTIGARVDSTAQPTMVNALSSVRGGSVQCYLLMLHLRF